MNWKKIWISCSFLLAILCFSIKADAVGYDYYNASASIEELKKDIQNYVKKHTAPYKYPRVVVFRDELPKTVSGKIQRNKL